MPLTPYPSPLSGSGSDAPGGISAGAVLSPPAPRRRRPPRRDRRRRRNPSAARKSRIFVSNDSIPKRTSSSVTHVSGFNGSAWARRASTRSGSPPRSAMRASSSAYRARNRVSCSRPRFFSTGNAAGSIVSSVSGCVSCSNASASGSRGSGSKGSGSSSGARRDGGAGGAGLAPRVASLRMASPRGRSRSRLGRRPRVSSAGGAAGGCAWRILGQSNSMSGLCSSIQRMASSSSAGRPTLTPGGVRNQ